MIATGSAPCGTAVAQGFVWVGVYGTGKLLRLDPDTGRVTRRIPVGSWACRVAVDEQAVWVTRDRAGVLVRVDLTTGRRQSFDVGASPFDVILAFGASWVTSFEVGTVARIDVATRRLTRVYKDAPNPAGITLRRSHLGRPRERGHVADLHRPGEPSPPPRRGRNQSARMAPLRLRRAVGHVSQERAPDRPTEGKVLGRVRLGGTPAEAAAGPDGLVWVTDKQRSLVHRIYAKRGVVVDSFAAGPGAYSLALEKS